MEAATNVKLRNADGDLVPVTKDVVARDKAIHGTISLLEGVQESNKQANKKVWKTWDNFFTEAYEKHGMNFFEEDKQSITLFSFDGKHKVSLSAPHNIVWNEKIGVAKKLIEEVVAEQYKDDPFINALVKQLLNSQQGGKVNTYALSMFRKIENPDPRWAQAQKTIGEAQDVSQGKKYIRAYNKDQKGAWKQIVVNFSAL